MATNETSKHRRKIWVIKDRESSDNTLKSMNDKNISGPFKEYSLSELGWYLLNPNPIIIKDRLIGCNITLKKSKQRKIKDKIKDFFFKKSEDSTTSTDLTREFISSSHVKSYTFRDPNLENHFKNIYTALKPYDSLLRMLYQLDISRVHEITGVCEDLVGNRYQLDLQGTVNDKLNYMTTNLLTDVNITMKRSYLSKGLFELRGFNFNSYNPSKEHRIIRFYKSGKACFCVLGKDKESRFIVSEAKLVHCMQLFQQSLETNSKLYEAVELCLKNEAKPFKLFFTKQLEFAYTNTHLPKIFHSNSSVSNLPPEKKTFIADTLNNQQQVISFNYVPQSEGGIEKMHTNISVMHAVKALEPIKKQIPDLFSEISRQAPVSDSGKYYLLDSMRGCQDE